MRKFLTSLTLLLLGAVGASAQGIYYTNNLLSNQGTPLVGANVAVCTPSSNVTVFPCTPLASIYSNEALTTSAPNPFSTDVNGTYSFWAAPGHYIIQIYGANLPNTTVDVFLPCDASLSSGSPGACASNITIPVTVANGGTGATTASGARTALGTPAAPATSNGQPAAIEPLTSDAVQYVSPSGNDSADGLSWGSAKLTISAGLAALTNGGVLHVAKGTLSFGTTVSPAANTVIEGSGPGTILSFTGTSGNAIGVPNANDTFENFTIACTDQTGSEEAFGGNGAASNNTTIRDVVISQCPTPVNGGGAAGAAQGTWNIINVTATGTGTTANTADGFYTGDAGVFVIIGGSISNFYHPGGCVDLNTSNNFIFGLKVSNCNESGTTGDGNGNDVDIQSITNSSASNNMLIGITVTEPNPTQSSGIRIAAVSGAPASYNMILGGTFTNVGINFAGASGESYAANAIQNAQFINNGTAGSTIGIYVYTNSAIVTNTVITGNTLNGWGTGIVVASGATGSTVANNSFSGNATNLNDAGTDSTSLGNQAYVGVLNLTGYGSNVPEVCIEHNGVCGHAIFDDSDSLAIQPDGGAKWDFSGYSGGSETVPGVFIHGGNTYTFPSAGGTFGLIISATTTSLTWSALSANSCANQSVTVSGATTSMVADADPSAQLSTGGNLDWSSRVSAANTIEIKICNVSTSSVTPNSVAWNVRVIQ